MASTRSTSPRSATSAAAGPRRKRWVSVSAFSSEDVFAVGFYDTGPPLPKIHTLVEHWDGLQWKILPSADPHDLDYLYGVAAVFADDVWAVAEGASRKVLSDILSFDPTPDDPYDCQNRV